LTHVRKTIKNRKLVTENSSYPENETELN